MTNATFSGKNHDWSPLTISAAVLQINLFTYKVDAETVNKLMQAIGNRKKVAGLALNKLMAFTRMINAHLTNSDNHILVDNGAAEVLDDGSVLLTMRYALDASGNCISAKQS